MSDSPAPASTGGNKTTIYLLGAVAILLVGVIVAIVLAMQNNKTVDQAQNANTPTNGSTAATGTGAMPGVGSSAGAEFDPATATQVPSGEKPGDYVERYYQAILDKKWDVAFKMQPATSQQGGTVTDFEQTQTSYGMSAFEIVNSTEQGDVATVEVQQDLGQNGKWGVTWTFNKYNDGWVVQSRKVQMMQ